MNNKVLVELVVPVLEESYDVFIPVNKKVGEIVNILSKLVSNISAGYFDISEKNCLYSGDTGDIYPFNSVVLNTDIRNGSKLILM